jgi:erythromycin esterase-like protein
MAEAKAARVAAEVVRGAARVLEGAPQDYDPLLKSIGTARFALLGEASHGTHEFYRERAEVTKRLITEKGYTAVAVEADWPDAYRVNRYVRGESDDRDAREALGGFKRFPTWMWRNTVVVEFVEWLRAYNDALPGGSTKVGFYGLDLYSLYTSIEAVLGYLDKVDPEAARRARARYSCFEHFGEDTTSYAYAAAYGAAESCEPAVVEQLVELRRRASELANRDGRVARDEFFHAEQNARLVKNAEEYYRSMFRGRVNSWNMRDRHMAETLDALVTHLSAEGQNAKVAVWEHNSHLGDARATEMGQGGEWNVGQLVRERYTRDAFLVGFTTHRGTVTASHDWDEPGRRRRVRPALEGSYEALFHEAGAGNFMLDLRAEGQARELLRLPRLERAIGVIYRPETERLSHYFHARLAEQFDAVLHFDETTAVEPLEQRPHWEANEEPPETYPSGF